MQLIIIEGVISAGKSTFCKNFSNEMNYLPQYEPVETNPYLERFYVDPKQHALPMQYWLMAHRFKEHKNAVEHVWRTGQTVVQDRSIYGDAVFAELNHLHGNIDELGYNSYLKMRDVMFEHVMIPQLTLFLDVSVENCIERIKMRSRSCECNIPAEYLQGLKDLYEKRLVELSSWGSTVVRLDWNTFRPVSEVIAELKDRNLISDNFREYPQIKG